MDNYSKYRFMMTEMVDRQAEFEERARIFQRLDIPRNHYYNVTNPDRRTSAKTDKPYYIPMEWAQKMTVDFEDYQLVREFCNDCGCICLTPKDVVELQSLSGDEPDKVMAIMKTLIGKVKK